MYLWLHLYPSVCLGHSEEDYWTSMEILWEFCERTGLLFNIQYKIVHEVRWAVRFCQDHSKNLATLQKDCKNGCGAWSTYLRTLLEVRSFFLVMKIISKNISRLSRACLKFSGFKSALGKTLLETPQPFSKESKESGWPTENITKEGRGGSTVMQCSHFVGTVTLLLCFT